MLLLPTRPRIWCRSLRPKLFALFINIVFAFDTSSPLSIIVVATSTSNSLFINPSISPSSFLPSNCPWPIPIFASGTKRCIIPATSFMFSMRLCTKKVCPPLDISYLMASLMVSSPKRITFVSTGCLLGGGVVITLKSLAAISENCSVLGIGVAVRVRVSTFSLMVLSLSFTATPNFCSSSIINRPRSLNSIALLTS